MHMYRVLREHVETLHEVKTPESLDMMLNHSTWVSICLHDEDRVAFAKLAHVSVKLGLMGEQNCVSGGG